MKNKKVTLSLESDVYERYAEHCRKNAMIVSKKVELFMKKELENFRKEGKR